MVKENECIIGVPFESFVLLSGGERISSQTIIKVKDGLGSRAYDSMSTDIQCLRDKLSRSPVGEENANR